MKTGIYKIICKKNNKIYIGSSNNIERRWNTHMNTLDKKTHRNPHLQNAWELYGKDEFVFEIIEICESYQLKDREQFWMDMTGCYNREIGFNNSHNSNSSFGYKHTEDAKNRMSELKKGSKQTKEVIEKRIEKMKGKKHTEETIEKIRTGKIGEKNPMFGKKEDEGHKKKRMINLLNTKKWNSGLTKKDDPRIEKLGYWKGKTTKNAKKCKLIDLLTNEIWEEDSINKLSNISPLSNSSLRRLIKNKASEIISKKYKIIVNE
jgi:group I intron endonuclease